MDRASGFQASPLTTRLCPPSQDDGDEKRSDIENTSDLPVASVVSAVTVNIDFRIANLVYEFRNAMKCSSRDYVAISN